MRELIVFGFGDESHKEIKALKKDYYIRLLLTSSEQEYRQSIENIKVKYISDVDLEEGELLIVDYYWKEKARLLFESFGIEKVKIFQWKNKNNNEYELKEVSGVPLFLNLKPDTSEEYHINCDRKKKQYNKHILFFSYYFPPIGGSPIQRTLKYIKYLSRKGYKITVVTVKPPVKEHIDNSLLEEVPDGVEVIRVANRFKENELLSVDDQKKIYRMLCEVDRSDLFLEELYKCQLGQIWYPLPDRLILWAADVYKELKNRVDMSDIDVIYSTVPEWSPLLLGYLVKKRYGIPWVTDYRDPWTASREYVELVYPFITKDEYLWQRKLERRLTREMDAMIQLDMESRQIYIKEFGVQDAKVHIIPNGYDEEDFQKINPRDIKNEVFTICYNGSLGYSRKPVYVLEAIRELIQDKIVEPDKIRWVFNGPISKKQFQEEIKRYDKYGIVQFNGMLSHVDSIQVASDADLLVVYGEYGTIGKYVVTGKFMEYLRIGRPILAFSSSDSPIRRILNETELGSNYMLEDVAGIKEFLSFHYRKWEESGNEAITYKKAIEKYSRENLADKLAHIFDELGVHNG